MFCPNGISQSVVVTTAPILIDISSADTETGAIRTIRGPTSGPVFLAFGDSGVVADTSSIACLAGIETFKIPTGSTHISLVVSGGSQDFYFTVGQHT